jgi:hypothetical protein
MTGKPTGGRQASQSLIRKISKALEANNLFIYKNRTMSEIIVTGNPYEVGPPESKKDKPHPMAEEIPWAEEIPIEEVDNSGAWAAYEKVYAEIKKERDKRKKKRDKKK